MPYLLLLITLLFTASATAKPTPEELSSIQELLYRSEYYEAKKLIDPIYSEVLKEGIQHKELGRCVVRMRAESLAYREDYLEEGLRILERLSTGHDDIEQVRAILACARIHPDFDHVRELAESAIEQLENLGETESAEYGEAILHKHSHTELLGKVDIKNREQIDVRKELVHQIEFLVTYPEETKAAAAEMHQAVQTISKAVGNEDIRFHYGQWLMKNGEMNCNRVVTEGKTYLFEQFKETQYQLVLDDAKRQAEEWRERNPVRKVWLSLAKGAYAYHLRSCETIRESRQLISCEEPKAMIYYERSACMVCEPPSSRSLPNTMRTFEFNGITYDLLAYMPAERSLAGIFQAGNVLNSEDLARIFNEHKKKQQQQTSDESATSQ